MPPAFRDIPYTPGGTLSIYGGLAGLDGLGQDFFDPGGLTEPITDTIVPTGLGQFPEGIDIVPIETVPVDVPVVVTTSDVLRDIAAGMPPPTIPVTPSSDVLANLDHLIATAVGAGETVVSLLQRVGLLKPPVRPPAPGFRWPAFFQTATGQPNWPVIALVGGGAFLLLGGMGRRRSR